MFVERRLVAKLRPHQREGVSYMFKCLSGLKQGGFTGAILMDGGLGGWVWVGLWALEEFCIRGSAKC